MKKVFRVFLVLCLAVLCVGCGKSGPESKLVGTWWHEENDGQYLEFCKDGTYKCHIAVDLVEGKYKIISEDQIELTSNATGLGTDFFHVAGVFEFSLDGDTFTLGSGGARGTYTREK